MLAKLNIYKLYFGVTL